MNLDKRFFFASLTLYGIFCFWAGAQTPAKDEKHVVVIAGSITGHGKNTHEYEKSAVLIKHLLDRSALKGLKTTVVFDGWPNDDRLLESADTIVLISDGGDHKETNHPLYNGDRFAKLEQQMNRGCGLVQLHWSTFNPSRYHNKITEWVGGYFDYEKGTAANKWYSAIKHYTEPIRLGEPEHPISNGVKPFRVLEEFYYRIRFRENDPRLKKIVMSRPTGDQREYAVGWAVERKDGGRGFGFTGGHYYANWWEPNFRKLVLNAIVWSAGVDVPKDGVSTKLSEPTKALIVTGHNHPAHKWQETTAALIQVIENDPRVLVDVTEDPEFLGNKKLSDYDVIVMNYSSWDRQGLSEKAKAGFVQFLKQGGGLSVIHFANGSWTDTLPNQESDWPEYRTKIVRRVWVHGDGNSGHDAFGDFRVTKTELQHPITDGLQAFPTKDELYYRQQGPLPIEPLITAVSRDTKKAEPMAWAYTYEKGKVFQTVLGHADVSILMASDVIRRGTIWAAGLENLSFDPPIERKLPYLWRSGAQWSPKTSAAKAEARQPSAAKKQQAKLPKLVAGKFGKALNARDGGVLGKTSKEIQEPDLTVECWVKIDSKNSFNIIAASETKSSLRHWELYTYAGTGHLSVYMPGIFGEIKSATDVCDGKWHYVAMTFEKQFVRLFVDGKQVKEQPINYRKHPVTNEGFAIGSLVEKTIQCDGIIDDFRLSNEIKKIDSVPTKPLGVEATTIGLWRFDKLNEKKQVEDVSKKKIDLATNWEGIAAKKVASAQTGKPKKITGHWGEDAIGFRWTEKDSEDNRWAFTQHGRFLTSTIPLPAGFAEKGLVVKVGAKSEAAVCYDLKRMNLMAGWSDGFLEFHQARFGLIRHLKPVGKMLFHNQPGLGWNRDKLTYHGLYPHGDRVLLDYSIGATQIQESPWLEIDGDTTAVSREMKLGKVSKPLMVPISSAAGATKALETKVGETPIVVVQVGDELVAAAVVADDLNTIVRLVNNQIWLSIAPNQSETLAKVLIWQGRNLNAFKKLVGKSKPVDPTGLQKVGPRKWLETVSTQGVVGEQVGMGYALDTIRLPFKNPYGSLFFVTGHDWLDNGDMVVATVHGEVWLAKNVDQKLENVTWKRYATGLYQPLGIRVVENNVYVLCRDQIVRLHDRDANDEVDFYECFHPDVTTSTGVHDYVCCLETDRDGNFYYIHANDGVVRVSKDGKQKTIVATGFRNPNGMGVRSDGLVTAAPQEGEWTPASAVCEVVPGRHYGYRGPKEKTAESPLGYEKPMVFLPRLVDNSSGGQFWSESDRWGRFQNQLFHLSYGKCTMMMVLRDQLLPEDQASAPITQGAVVPFPFVFESGACRGRMSPHDGQLYVCGLKGWTTAAVRDGSLQRVRFLGDGQSNGVFCPSGYKVFANGIELEFTQPIQPDSIQASSFQVEAWNYRYSKNYGSPEFKVSKPSQQGRDQWVVKSAKLSSGNRKVFLEIPQLTAVDQLGIQIKLSSESSQFNETIYATVKEKRSQSVVPGKPFNQALAKFEKQLQRGVFVNSHGWEKMNLDWFSKSEPGEKLSLACWLRIESPQTVLRVKTGSHTSGQIKVTPLNHEVTFLQPIEAELKKSFSTAIPLSLESGYCRVELQLESEGNAIQMRTSWASREFGTEPIPSRNLFFDREMSKPVDQFANHQQLISVGQILIDRNCTQCHRPAQAQSPTESNSESRSPDLKSLGSRRTRGYVMRKILDPHFESNGATMPKLFDRSDLNDRRDANDLVAFLVTKNAATTTEKTDDKMVERGEQFFEQLGCIGCHHLPMDSDEDRYDRISLKFTDNKFTRQGLRLFLRDPHRHAPYRKMGNFKLTSSESEALAQFIEKYSSEEIQDLQQVEFEKSNPARGKKLFVSYGCSNCHETESSLEQVSFDMDEPDAGCLSDKTTKSGTHRIPDLGLKPAEKERLKQFLLANQKANVAFKDSLREAGNAIPGWKQASHAMQELRCSTCHNTAAEQARLPEIVLEEGTLGLNPERLPDLTQVGNKLNAGWLKQFLQNKNAAAARPWLKTRMPYFGSYAKVLAHGIPEQAGIDSDHEVVGGKIDSAIVEVGSRLTQPNGGLDCRQCHGVGDSPPRGDEKTQIVLGVNFSQVNQRLRKDFYDRWMRDPLRIDPQTKMPKYSSAANKTKITEILDGDAGRQFDAIWQYLESLDQSKH